MRNMRSQQEHEKMSSLARRLGHEAGALAICAETRRPQAPARSAESQ
jgi:hypothetical protein